MFRPGIGRLLHTPGVALLIIACDGLVPCTDPGCGPALTVRLSGAPEGEHTLTATSPGHQPVQFLCAGTECTPIEPSAYAPDEVTIILELPETTIVQDFVPEYRTYRPNGRDCAPECRRAEVVLVVEE